MSIAQEEEIAELKRVRATHLRMIEDQTAELARLRRERDSMKVRATEIVRARAKRWTMMPHIVDDIIRELEAL